MESQNSRTTVQLWKLNVF